ncbi:hypothetical protein C7R91_00720 [Brevibacillus formosus]|nr:hypothetical protein C7R91_00720 [Brevibacillus formosus]
MDVPDAVNEIINQFVHALFPIVCSARSKSTLPFWVYHLVSMNLSNLADCKKFEVRSNNHSWRCKLW